MREYTLVGITFEMLIVLAAFHYALILSKNIYEYINSLYLIPICVIKSTEYLIKYNYPTDNNNIIQTKMSSIHAFLLSIANILYIYNRIDNDLWKYVILYSLYYNLLDLLYLVRSDIKIKNQMIIHHLLLIICITPCLNNTIYSYINAPDNYNLLVANNFLCEITTIPLNMSWILNSQKKQNSTEFKFWSIMTLLLYFPVRVCMTTYLSYNILNYSTPFKYFQFILTILNYYWFYKLILKCLSINSSYRNT